MRTPRTTTPCSSELTSAALRVTPTKEQGVILGSVGEKNELTALVDTDDVHTLMIGASGVGKTAFFLYPNLEYACASGMSFLCTDTKGDLFRNYGTIAKDNYDYRISVIDLRNPTRSDGNNMLHKALGSRTVMSGSISRGKNDPGESLQMMERPLMTPDELKSIPKGEFIVMKTGTHPMRTRLRLFLDWGITFGEPYSVPERATRKVAYADKHELERSIMRKNNAYALVDGEPPEKRDHDGMLHTPVHDRGHRRPGSPQSRTQGVKT